MNKSYLSWVVVGALALATNGCSASGSASASASASTSTSSTSTSGSDSSAGSATTEEPPVEEAPVEEPPPPPVVVEPPPPPPLETVERVRCAGREEITLANIQIDGGANPAITASGNCVVTVTVADLRSTGSAIRATGNARVIINGGSVSGAPAASAAGNAQVELNTVTVTGELDHRGRATVTVTPTVAETPAP